MSDFTPTILHELSRRDYQPLKPKALARKLGVPDGRYPEFRKTLKALTQDGRVELGKNNVLRPADQFGSAVGIYRRTNAGHGYVRPHAVDGTAGPESVFVINTRRPSSGID